VHNKLFVRPQLPSTFLTTNFPDYYSFISMAPTILVIGATGNTGRGIIETLPKLLGSGSALSDHRIIALTRSLKNPTAQGFAKLPDMTVLEKN
jgi:hypothetical protein